MAPPSPSTDSTVVTREPESAGRYTLLAKLATGGMAEIFLARQQGSMGFEKLVVIKRILESYAEDPDFVSMFLDEARIASQLSHPGIVQIYDLGEEQGTYFIAMEYLAGESLAMVARTAMQSGEPLPVSFAVKLVADAAGALGYAHAKTDSRGEPLHIVHRDVSPHNLFVTYEGNLKVLDFGIAKAANRATKTVGNQVKGTMAYMSTEQVQGRAVDARADVFALGVVLFEAVTRSRLFQRDEPGAVYAAVVGPDPIPRASERNSEIDAELDDIVAQALERDPDARFQSAQDMQTALESWLRHVAAPKTSDVAALMGALFDDRIHKRAELMERAQRGEEISSVTVSRRLGTTGSMPGMSSVQPAPTGARLNPLWIAVITAIVVIVLGSVALFAFRPTPTATPLVVQAISAPTPAPAAPKPTQVEIDTEPSGGLVSIDKVEKGPAPLSLGGLPLGTHELRAQLAGRPDAVRTLVLEAPGQSVQLTLHFPAVSPAPPAPPPPSAPPPSLPPAAAEHPRHAPSAPKVTAAAPTPPPAEVRMGKLTLDTTPWTEVFDGATSLGQTPLVLIPLSVGAHRLKLVNTDKKVQQSVEAVIGPDKPTVIKLRF
jgi:serine/threonine protein kinase